MVRLSKNKLFNIFYLEFIKMNLEIFAIHKAN